MINLEGRREGFSQFNAQNFKLHTKMLRSNWIKGFLDHQYLQKKLIDLLDFFHKCHQRNDKS